MPPSFDTDQLIANPPTLTGHTIRLEPLEQRHAQDLLAAAEPSVFTYHRLAPRAFTDEAFAEYIEASRSMPDRVPFAMVLGDENRAVGTSSFLELRPLHRGIEIGYTWIGPRYQGTRVNPESKLLMLEYAFETLGAMRVQLNCDARNLQSQAAISKLGALREGVLRKHMLYVDGRVRDTVMFSIVDDEWPSLKAALERRLER
jgi:RimJ/RimL family protein N-acetyltransferase